MRWRRRKVQIPGEILHQRGLHIRRRLPPDFLLRQIHGQLRGIAWRERAMRLDQTDRRHSIWFFFAGFAELLLGRTEAAIALLRKSLERNPSYGAAQLFLMVALSAVGRRVEAEETAATFRKQYPDYRTTTFEQLWLSRSGCSTYRAQIHPLFEKIRTLGVAN